MKEDSRLSYCCTCKKCPHFPSFCRRNGHKLIKKYW